ncbi:MAG: ribonuclease Z [Candidatus Pacearchaeota archaeon]
MAEKIKLIFLGTGSMIPDEKRGHPSFLISYKAENILIDCGEGTQIQFRKARLNPCKITRILITHWHGDHTFGLPGLLRTLSTSGYNKKLFVYGPKGIRKHFDDMLKAFGVVEGFQLDVREVSGKFFENEDFYIESEEMIHVQPCNAYNFVIKEKIRINKKKMREYGIKEGPHLAELKDKGYMIYKGKRYVRDQLTYIEKRKKISFVLDTLFNNKISQFVKNADIFVCESSFASDLLSLAKSYQHLTSKQAAEIAKTARVSRLILTHLSQRYSKNPEMILKEAKKIFKNTSLAKDLDSIVI